MRNNLCFLAVFKELEIRMAKKTAFSQKKARPMGVE